MISAAALPAFITHPAMLLWAAAAAAPLILHLLNRRKHREASWAAITFLLEAVRKNARRVRIEHWLLLALRTLIILLVVLAAAEPYLQSAGIRFVSGQRAHRVLVLDGSFSMAYQPSDKSRFERAKELAAQIVDESRQGDGFTLVLMSAPARAVVAAPAFEPRAFLDELENLDLPHAAADPPGALNQIAAVLAAARSEHPKLTREEVYFITDLGRASWTPQFTDSAATEEFRALSRRLASETAVFAVLDVGDSGAENVAVTSLRAAEPFTTASRYVTVTGEVRNFGRQPRPRQLVELFIDERRAGQETLDLAPGEAATVSFTHRFETPGEHRLELRAAGDLLDVDNHRWLSLPVRESIRVLCVDGKPAAGAVRGATDYLAVALAPYGGENHRSPVEPHVVPESALVELDLNDYACIFLANIGQFTPSEARRLEAYLARGGGLVFFLGDQVAAESYNRQLGGQGEADRGVLPAVLGETTPAGEYLFDPLDYAHPIVSSFAGHERAGLLTAPTYRYVRLTPRDDLAAETALAFHGGDPAVVAATVRRGRSIVVATSASDQQWTTLPLWPSFVPIVQELLADALRGQSEQRNGAVGQAFGEALSSAANEASVIVRTPGEQTERVRVTIDADAPRWSFDQTFTSGVYAAEQTAPSGEAKLFAVNVDVTESDLTRLDPVELADQIWPGVAFDHQTQWRAADEDSAVPLDRPTDGPPLFLLSAAFGLLLTETFLAWRFGHHAP